MGHKAEGNTNEVVYGESQTVLGVDCTVNTQTVWCNSARENCRGTPQQRFYVTRLWTTWLINKYSPAENFQWCNTGRTDGQLHATSTLKFFQHCISKCFEEVRRSKSIWFTTGCRKVGNSCWRKFMYKCTKALQKVLESYITRRHTSFMFLSLKVCYRTVKRSGVVQSGDKGGYVRRKFRRDEKTFWVLGVDGVIILKMTLKEITYWVTWHGIRLSGRFSWRL